MINYSPRLQHISRSLVLVLGLACTVALAQTKQEQVHHMAHTVMPFDLAKTMHVFRMTESGGVERVIVTDAKKDQDQVAPIQ